MLITALNMQLCFNVKTRNLFYYYYAFIHSLLILALWNSLFLVALILQIMASPVAEWYWSKLADGRCQGQTLVEIVDLAVLSFPWFSPKLA